MLFKDKSAFQSAFMDFYNPLCNYANHLLHDEHTAEDIVQDVFLKMWEINKSNSESNIDIKNYLYKSTKNKVLEYIRSNKTYGQLKLKYNYEQISSLNDDEQSEKYTLLERLNSSLRHLPPKCKKVFALHKLNGLTYAEIAEAENVSIKTVENHMSNAYKILRKRIKEL